MKSITLLAAFTAAIAGSASAQMVFESGSVDGTYYNLSGSDFIGFGLGGRADYQLGGIGIQFDGGGTFFSDGVEPVSEYSIGVHAYKELPSGMKLGGYANIDLISGFLTPSITLKSFGAEGIMSFGNVDFEASVGRVFESNFDDGYWIADLDAYYEISPAIEISAGAVIFFDSGSSSTVYKIGAQYTLANMPLSIGANYLMFEGGGDDFNIGISYAFGPKTDERLFSSRAYPLYIGG